MAGKPLNARMLKFSLATDVALCLLGVAVYLRLFPASVPLLGQLPPNAGLPIAALFALGAVVTLLTSKRRRETEK